MSLSLDHHRALERFVGSSDIRKGAWFIDLDGVIFNQDKRGKITVSKEAEGGIRDMLAMGCPVIINSLRFPVSLIKSVAASWLLMFEKEIPAVLLKGSLIGRFVKRAGAIIFEEKIAYPLKEKEIDEIVNGVADSLESHLVDRPHILGVYFYPRDWRTGEIVWVPEGTRITKSVRDKFVNASEVFTCNIDELRMRIKKAGPCMVATLVDKYRTDESRSPMDFYTTKDVDKASGTHKIAEMLGISLTDSAAAGDSLMDIFLNEVGLAVCVQSGKEKLEFKGTNETLVVASSAELGEVMSSLARLAGIHSSIKS